MASKMIFKSVAKEHEGLRTGLFNVRMPIFDPDLNCVWRDVTLRCYCFRLISRGTIPTLRAIINMWISYIVN